jgi:DNA-binding SARP family transcriptional activator
MNDSANSPNSLSSVSLLEIHTFGGLRILRGGEAVTGLASRKVEALLVYLSVTGRSQPREVLADFLWDDFSQSRAMNNLRVVLSNLRKHLGDYVTISRDAVSVNAENQLWLDVAELEAHLKVAQDQEARTGILTADSAGRIQKATALYDGEFLQGFSVRGSRGFDDWFSLERERLHRLVLEGLGRLVGWQLEHGKYPAGIESATRWLQLDPLREAAHRQMMLLLAYNGQMGAAVGQYEACGQVLDEELGIPLSEETTALYEMIREGELPPLTQERTPPVEEERDPPFKGLQYFDVGDAELFFGREGLTAKLVDALRGGRFLAVVGASGSGKSSLVRAGLVPALMNAEPLADGSRPPAGSSQWPIHIITPTTHPLEALAASLTRDAESVTATATLMDDLAKDPRSLHLYVRKLLSQDGGGRLLLLVDQFEELFTLCRDEDERRAFVDNLLTAVAEETAGPTMVVTTLRADFYAHCAQYADLRTLLSNRQIYIGQMEAEELRRAIEGPAHHEGYDFEPGLVELFLRDIGVTEEGQPEPGALPLLSHALLETWKRRRGQTLTFAGYSESGGVYGAIAQTAEQVFHQQLTGEQQAIARNIFLRSWGGRKAGRASGAADAGRRPVDNDIGGGGRGSARGADPRVAPVAGVAGRRARGAAAPPAADRGGPGVARVRTGLRNVVSWRSAGSGLRLDRGTRPPAKSPGARIPGSVAGAGKTGRGAARSPTATGITSGPRFGRIGETKGGSADSGCGGAGSRRRTATPAKTLSCGGAGSGHGAGSRGAFLRLSVSPERGRSRTSGSVSPGPRTRLPFCGSAGY